MDKTCSTNERGKKYVDIFVGRPGKKKPFGTPRHKREDIILKLILRNSVQGSGLCSADQGIEFCGGFL
jgi:hypothetical protein